MLLIPIGQDDTQVKRTPWVSYALVVANLVVFALLLGGDEREETWARARRHFQGAVDYLTQHPYLEVPPLMQAYASDTLLSSVRRGAEQWRRAQAVPKASVVEAEQRELQRRLQRFADEIGDLPSRRFGFVPGAPSLGSAVSSQFLHAGWGHLLGNMFVLLLCAPFVEDVFGRPLFLLLYLVSGGVAALFHAARTPESMVPLVGASGAISGVMGLFLIRLSTARIQFLVVPLLLVPRVRSTVALPAFVVLPLWLMSEVSSAQRAGADAPVAFWAHVGGFLCGVLFGILLRVGRVEERWVAPAIESKIGFTQHPALERAAEARLRGDLATARREIALVLREAPDNLDGWMEGYAIAQDSGEEAEASRRAVHALDLCLAEGEPAVARRLLDEVLRRGSAHLPARFHLDGGALLEREGDARTALVLYGRLVEEAPRSEGAFDALVRMATLRRRGGDRRGAIAAYLEARAHPSCAGRWPGFIDRALADLRTSAA